MLDLYIIHRSLSILCIHYLLNEVVIILACFHLLHELPLLQHHFGKSIEKLHPVLSLEVVCVRIQVSTDLDCVDNFAIFNLSIEGFKFIFLFDIEHRLDEGLVLG